MYVQQNVVGHHDGLRAAAAAMKDGVAQEVHLFTDLDLRRLIKPPTLEYVMFSGSIIRILVCMYVHTLHTASLF